MIALRWASIAALSGGIALVVAFVASYPLAKQAFEDHDTQKRRMRFARGLSPCSPDDLRLLAEALPPLPPANADLTITVFPSFSAPSVLRVTPAEVRLFTLGELRPKHNDGESTAKLPSWRTSAGKVVLSRQRVGALRDALASEIAHGYAELEMGLDGTSYYFQTSDDACACTWSPEPATRAGAWVALSQALAEAAGEGDAQTVDAQALEQAADALLTP